MAVAFNADEIFRIGVEIERNGRAFYEEAARRAKDPGVRKVFDDLARWEDRHVETFEKMRAGVSGSAPVGALEDPTDEVAGYFRAAADSHAFGAGSDPVALAASCTTPLAAFEQALRFEKDTVVVYTSMRMLVPPSLGRDEVDRLVDEELRHVKILRDLIESRGGK